MKYTILIGLTLVSYAICAADLDSLFAGCTFKSDPEVDACLIKVFERMNAHAATGVPSLKIPPLEPIKLGNFAFKQNEGQVNIDGKFSEVLVNGFSTYKLQSLRSTRTSPTTGTLNIELTIPELRVTGQYTLGGNMLLLPISGSGPFGARLIAIKATLVGNLQFIEQSQLWSVPDVKVDFQLERARVKLLNLFNGDKVLGDTVNHFLNNNDQLIINEIKPAVSRDISALVQKLMDAAYKSVPARYTAK